MVSADEITPGIFRIKQALTFRQIKFAVNIYVLAGENGLVFDSGFGNRRAGKSLVANIKHITDILNNRGQPCSINMAMTSHGHWDHFSGLGYLQKTLGLEILATKRQAAKLQSKQTYKKLFSAKSSLIRRPASPFFQTLNNARIKITKEIFMSMLGIRFVQGHIRNIDGNATLDINNETWELIDLSGHCDDDMGLYNRKSGVLLSGDILLRDINTWLGPPSSDLDQYFDTLYRLRKLPNLKLILPAHGSPITDPLKRIQETIEHRKNRIQEIFQLISQSGNKGISFETIFKHYYPRSRRIMGTTLRGWIIVTLEHLLHKGDIILTLKDRDVIFKAN